MNSIIEILKPKSEDEIKTSILNCDYEQFKYLLYSSHFAEQKQLVKLLIDNINKEEHKKLYALLKYFCEYGYAEHVEYLIKKHNINISFNILKETVETYKSCRHFLDISDKIRYVQTISILLNNENIKNKISTKIFRRINRIIK